MIQASFDLEIKALQKDLEQLGRQAPIVMARALNRAAVSGQTAMVKAVATDTGLAQKNIKREIRIDKATRTTPTVALEIQGRRIPLIAFQARGPEPSRGRGRGVRYSQKGGLRGHIPNAFIATMESGHRGVFVRSKKNFMKDRPKRHAIDEKFGPSLPHVFEKFLPQFQAAAQESLVKNLRSEISFARSKQQATD